MGRSRSVGCSCDLIVDWWRSWVALGNDGTPYQVEWSYFRQISPPMTSELIATRKRETRRCRYPLRLGLELLACAPLKLVFPNPALARYTIQ